jgi:sarcosine oxidase subunit alpha
MSAPVTAARLGDDPAEERLTFVFDGAPVEARRGETIGAALLAAGRRALGRGGRDRRPRGLYCAMGVCWECAVIVEGRTVRACVALVAPGLRAEPVRGRAGP